MTARGGKRKACRITEQRRTARDRYEYISDQAAREWLLGNGFDDAAAEYFGPVPEEEDRRPGRPVIGTPVNIRLGDDLLAMVDTYAAQRSISRAEAIRRLTQDAVTRARTAEYAPLPPQVTKDGYA
jgi:hypothetical protein